MHKTAQICSVLTRVNSSSRATWEQRRCPSVRPLALTSSGRYALFFYFRPQPESQQKLGEVPLPRPSHPPPPHPSASPPFKTKIWSLSIRNYWHGQSLPIRNYWQWLVPVNNLSLYGLLEFRGGKPPLIQVAHFTRTNVAEYVRYRFRWFFF